MANRGMSLHIGVNEVDPSQYADFKEKLDGCVFDAEHMHEIAFDRKFETVAVLRDGDATHEAVVAGIEKAYTDLKQPGDFFLLTFSGHGSHVKDLNDDEDGGDDETWCLSDFQMLDDELFGHLAEFEKDVRVLVIADCCFSGNQEGPNGLLNVNRRRSTRRSTFRLSGRDALYGKVQKDDLVGKFRNLPEEFAKNIGEEQAELFEKIQKEKFPKGRKVHVKASVILLSACHELELAKDGKDNGVFTKVLKNVWNDGAFDKGYQMFRDQILDEIRKGLLSAQTPKIRQLDVKDPVFFAQKPFTI